MSALFQMLTEIETGVKGGATTYSNILTADECAWLQQFCTAHEEEFVLQVRNSYVHKMHLTEKALVAVLLARFKKVVKSFAPTNVLDDVRLYVYPPVSAHAVLSNPITPCAVAPCAVAPSSKHGLTNTNAALTRRHADTRTADTLTIPSCHVYIQGGQIKPHTDGVLYDPGNAAPTTHSVIIYINRSDSGATEFSSQPAPTWRQVKPLLGGHHLEFWLVPV